MVSNLLHFENRDEDLEIPAFQLEKGDNIFCNDLVTGRKISEVYLV